MHGKIPYWGMVKNGVSLMEKMTMAIFLPLIFKRYKFEENYFPIQKVKCKLYQAGIQHYRSK